MPVVSSHQLAEHVGEVRLVVRAASLGELLSEAGRAVAGLELGAAGGTAGGEWRPLEVSAPDREALLVEWLNELVFRAESERWVPAEFEPERVTATRARLLVRGVTVPRAPGLVKAATYHGVAVREMPGGLEAEVVLDV